MKNYTKIKKILDSGHWARCEYDLGAKVFTTVLPDGHLSGFIDKETAFPHIMAKESLINEDQLKISIIPAKPKPYAEGELVELNCLAPKKLEKYQGHLLIVGGYSGNNDIYDLKLAKNDSWACYNVPHFALSPVF